MKEETLLNLFPVMLLFLFSLVMVGETHEWKQPNQAERAFGEPVWGSWLISSNVPDRTSIGPSYCRAYQVLVSASDRLGIYRKIGQE